MNSIAYCGLACCVCSENVKCVGCQSGGCDIHGWCKNYNCCREKGIAGCWECDDFPCQGGMLDKPRIRAFARFAKEYGTDELTRCLLRNKENGIIYHYNGQLVGDYDKCKTEEGIMTMISHAPASITVHYDTLIDENNDPVRDIQIMREYMDKWDGQVFIDELQLSKDKSVLEIGVGTGRLAVKTVPQCGKFTGIDISPKTIYRAKENLTDLPSVMLICDDFMLHKFDEQFDVIYSSLTFMHISDKLTAINKVAGLLAPYGRFVLSIDKNQEEFIDAGFSKVKVYPDNPDEICGYLKAACLKIEKQFETEFAVVVVTKK
jgi:ubiquinone/menaquinone biosynthesis C-methylase UbiE